MKKIFIKEPWGEEEQFTLNEMSTVKILRVKPGAECSLQYHKSRQEFWKVLSGQVWAVVGEETVEMKVGDEVEIPIGIKHRLKHKDGDAQVLEISFGTFDEKDIVRLEDDYGRV
ncbi:MAG: phosphomannose isomerase type II C-terminal cupin domain [Minisyncoccia bacterium]